ncbi:hypothetical protein PGT21_034955 [Puccinia graminis f. sp. tritici]|uniref:Uncharacterized protein n=1 Tax=Puccinia graminis f. sp. tritici TaxID=56615 RepID=A0A5B0PCR1_PUCGR|nr:hypothetical protein PGT21_034955 [Puccinia graminis f. sp. tritici]KAA1125691.1 hypothetical protein PGTUg99_022399 [Puccinia graminis f. sp. tritici]
MPEIGFQNGPQGRSDTKDELEAAINSSEAGGVRRRDEDRMIGGYRWHTVPCPD